MDELADVDLSNFILPDQRPLNEVSDNTWSNTSSTGSISIDDVDNRLSPSSNDDLIGTAELAALPPGMEGMASAAAVDWDQSQDVRSRTAPIDSSNDWHSENSTNPFRTSTSDLLVPTPSPNNPFRDNATKTTAMTAMADSTRIPSTNPFGFGSNATLQSSNPFLEQSSNSNNPFRSHSPSDGNELSNSLFEFSDASTAIVTGPTEYVYMSRLPGENIGMVLGIDGDQDNRRPIKSVHVKSITPGGAAARACEGSNRILVGDEIREIDGQALRFLTHDECIGFLQEMPDTVVLTIYRQQEEPDNSDGSKENAFTPALVPTAAGPLQAAAPERAQLPELHSARSMDDTCDAFLEGNAEFVGVAQNAKDRFQESCSVEGEAFSDISNSHNPSQVPKGFKAVGVTIFKQESDNLGISIVPSYGSTCDLYQIKRLLPDGAGAKVQRLEIGDRLLTCNGRSLRGLGQVQCLQVLKSSGPVVDLICLRPCEKQTSLTATAADYNASLLSSSVGQTVVHLNDNELTNYSDDTPFSSQEETSSSSNLIFKTNDEEGLISELNPDLTTQTQSCSYHGDEEIPGVNSGTSDNENDDPFSYHGAEFTNEVEERVHPSENSLIHIPPPVEFSDLTSKREPQSPLQEVGDQSLKCVTNIDDLLFLDTQNEAPSNNSPRKPDDQFIDLSDNSSQNPANFKQSLAEDDLLNLGSRSIEEFAEKCFESITDQTVPESGNDSLLELSQTDVSYQENSDPNNSSSLLTSDQSFNHPDSPKGSHVTVFPVSTQPQQFVSTIPIPAKRKSSNTSPTSPSVSSTESQPFSTTIQVTPTASQTQSNVTKIDIVLTSKPEVCPATVPTATESYTHPDNIVFHTYADNKKPVLSSTTISLDGEPSMVFPKMNGYQATSATAGGGDDVEVHTTIGIPSKALSGEDEEIIRPRVVSKNCQGKILAVAPSQETVTSSSSSPSVKTLNYSALSGLADTLAKHDSHIYSKPHQIDDLDLNNGFDAAEEEIVVPAVISRNDKEIAMGVMSKWQNTEENVKLNPFQKTVSALINSTPVNSFSHTTIGQASNAKTGEEEEMIVPMAAAKDQQGKSLRVLASPKTALPDTEKDMSGLLKIADLMSQHLHIMDNSPGMSKPREKEDEKDNMSEETIVPTILTKDQTQAVKVVIDKWGTDDAKGNTNTVGKAANGFMRNTNTVSQNGLVHTTVGVMSSARSGEEEELIQPMRVTKDLQGKPLCLPSEARAHSPIKEKDMSALVNFASSLLNDDATVNKLPRKERAEESQYVSEEVILPTILTKDQAQTARSVIQSWDSNMEHKPTTIEKAASGFLRGASIIPDGATVHTTIGIASTARSGEEEELIQPMNVAKDLQGKHIRVQSSRSETTPKSERTLNESALQEFARALASSTSLVSTKSDVSNDKEISEDAIKPVAKATDQQQVVSSVIDRWNVIGENPSLLQNVVSRTKSSEHKKELDMPDSRVAIKDHNLPNGDFKQASSPSEKPSPRKEKSTEKLNSETASTSITSDIIKQSKSSSGQKSSYRDAINLFEQAENQKPEVRTESVVLRSKPQSSTSTGFKAKLEGFKTQDSMSSSSTSSVLRSGRPKSMFDISSSRTGYSPRSSGTNSDRPSTFKPLTTIKALGPSIAHKRASVTLTERPGGLLQGSSFLSQTPREDYPKTRQADGSPFQQNILAGIVGLGLKVNVTDGYTVIVDIQRSGPLAKSGIVKVGDYLLSVNGKDLSDQTDARVQQILRLVPRGLVKLVVAGKKPEEAGKDTANLSTETNGDLLASEHFETSEAPPATTVTVNNTTFIATANGIQQLMSHDKSNSLTELNLPISTSASELPPNDDQQPPITARIEISPSNQKGAPMRIAIKPAPTPRHAPGAIARPNPMPRYAYASSTNESWDTSSEDSSTPREPASDKKVLSVDVIENQKKPAEDVLAETSVAIEISKQEVTVSESISSPKEPESMAPVQDIIVKEMVGIVNTSPKVDSVVSSPRKVPPPVAPKEPDSMVPVQDIVVKEMVGIVNTSPKVDSVVSSPRKVPPPVAPKPRHSSSSSTKSDDADTKANDKEEQHSVVAKSTAKISAGYERLQAMTKAKPAKSSKVLEKSRTFVSSTTKLFNDKATDGDSSRNVSSGTPAKLDMNRINSSLLPANQRRQSTGSVPFSSNSFSTQRVSTSYNNSLSRPKSLRTKGNNIPSEVTIPEATSPRDSVSPEAKAAVLSPTRINSALSPRRASSVDTPSPVVFKFSQTTAPKIDTIVSTEGKTLNSALSSHNNREKFGVHKITSPTSSSSPSHKFDSRSQSFSQIDSPIFPSRDNSAPETVTPSNRRKSTSSLLSSRSSSVTSPIREEVLEDTMKKFDDLLMDAPYSHTETDPSELLLWAPLRKEPSSLSNTFQKSKSDTQTTTAIAKQEPEKPTAQPRRKLDDSDNKSDTSGLEKAKPVLERSLVSPVSSNRNIDTHLALTDNDSFSLKDSLDERVVKEDVITASSHTKAETRPGNNHSQRINASYDYENLIRESSDNDDNILAQRLAEEIAVDENEEESRKQKIISGNEEKIRPEKTSVSETIAIQNASYDYENLIRESSDNDDNILAQRLAEEIAVDKDGEESRKQKIISGNEEKIQPEKTSVSESIAIQNDVTEIENSSESVMLESVQILNKSLVSENGVDSLSQNIPASILALDMSHEDEKNEKQREVPTSQLVDVDYTSQLVDVNCHQNNETFSLPQDGNEDGKSESNSQLMKDDAYENHARQIVDGVFEKISFNTVETNELEDDASSSEDEGPPPLPGAPPPPIIFRTNTALLTEREWLEDNEEDLVSGSKAGLESSAIPETIRESADEQDTLPVSTDDVVVEEMISDSFTSTEAAIQNNAPASENANAAQISLLSSDLSSKDTHFDMNIVSQNTAMAMQQDNHSLDEEGQSRSDSMEPLNSTGDSCHESFAVRVSSPSSVDVLSEDSGMPADDEFQEVNTDDALSPSSDSSRDFIQEQNSKSSHSSHHSQGTAQSSDQSELVKSSSESISVTDSHVTMPDSKAFTATVDNELEISMQSPPPMLPVSAPPNFLDASQHNANSLSDITSAPQAPPSVFQPSSSEVFSNGEVLVTPEVDLSHVEVVKSVNRNQDKATTEEEQIIKSPPASFEPSETVSSDSYSHSQEKLVENSKQTHMGGENEISASDLYSDRKWSLFSNKSDHGAVLSGQPGSTTCVRLTEEILMSSLPIATFISLMAKVNDILNTLKAPQDTEILVMHLHREGDSVPLGLDLRTEQEFWYKVSSINESSPAGKQGVVENGDFLLAVDNLVCTQCSVMRCMARLTKPKHDSILVLARLHSQSAAKESKSTSATDSEDKTMPRERPAVAPRTSRTPPVPAAKPRQIKSPPPLSPTMAPSESISTVRPVTPPSLAPSPPSSSPRTPEKQVPESAPGTASQSESPSKEGGVADKEEDKSAVSATPTSGTMKVIMMKGATGVGFCLEGGVGSPKGNMPIIIKRIFKGGPAERCGQLKVKDEILEVNDVSFTEMRHYEAWNHLKFLDDGEVHLKIRRPE